MNNFKVQLKSGVQAGVRVGWSSFIWICKITIPISFLVVLLKWTGWLYKADFILSPLMNFIHLPPEAALVILSGVLVNIYAVIAAITTIPFTIEQMTLIAIFNLIAHNLIMEGIIQHKSGMSIIKMTLIRLTVAILTVLAVSPFFGDTARSIAVPAALTAQTPLLEVLKSWALDMIILLSKIFGIIMFLMILLESLRTLGWMEYLLNFFRPVMKVLGLSSRTTMMWVAANTFGLLFGGAVIVAEAKREALTRQDLESLHIFVGINHSVLEDVAYFALLGVSLFWLWVPRFIVAVIAVQIYGAISRLAGRFSR